MSRFEEKTLDFFRKGDKDKIRWMEKIDKVILPSQIKRIQQNDKTVLMEMVLPKWVNWSLLYDWAQNKKLKAGKICILCEHASENGIYFLEKHVCESCFLKLKHMQ